MKPLPPEIIDCLYPSPRARAELSCELAMELYTASIALPFVFSPREKTAIAHTYVAAMLRANRSPK